MANQLIFSTEQRVLIYDQYLLTRSASQVRRLFETQFPVVKFERVFHDRIISRDLWPARSLVMTPCDFYLWGRLKNIVYKTNPRTLVELKRNIHDEINIINRGEPQRVMGNFIKRRQKCMDNEGGQFQHLRQ